MNVKMTVTLPKEEVENAVRKALETQGLEVKSLRFDIGTETRGYGPMEYDTTVFRGVVCEVTKKESTNG